LNTPLVNFEYIEACFADKLATGKFAMGSIEPLSKPIQVEQQGKPIDLENQATNGEGFVEAQAAFDIGVHGSDASTPSPSSSNRKRKRATILSDEDEFRLATCPMHCVMLPVLSITLAILKHTLICAKLLWILLNLRWIKDWLFWTI
jgi:hypothetical protein